MTDLIRKLQARPDGSSEILVTPESAGWAYVGFHYLALKAGSEHKLETGDREVCLVLMSGKADAAAGNEKWSGIGKRMSVFEPEKPFAVYAGGGREMRITALTDCELGICSAPQKTGRKEFLITPDMLNVVERGKGQNLRYICDIMMGNLEADSLLVVEVKTPTGNWSSYPPHKHDKDNLPHESLLEETYMHKVNPPQGYVVQRVYNDDESLNETMAVKNNETVLVPEGYHPVGVPYGYESYYLNTMAGPKREWVFHNDPNHEWIIKRDAGQ